MRYRGNNMTQGRGTKGGTLMLERVHGVGLGRGRSATADLSGLVAARWDQQGGVA